MPNKSVNNRMPSKVQVIIESKSNIDIEIPDWATSRKLGYVLEKKKKKKKAPRLWYLEFLWKSLFFYQKSFSIGWVSISICSFNIILHALSVGQRCLVYTICTGLRSHKMRCPSYDVKLYDEALVQEECGVHLYWHNSQVHSESVWSYLLGSQSKGQIDWFKNYLHLISPIKYELFF